MSKLIPASIAALAVTLSLSACGSDDSATDSPTTSSSASATTSDAAKTAALTVVDPWVKTAKSGMSAVFGTLTNSGDQDVTVTAAAASVADMVQLHETTQTSDGSSSMQEKKDGFVVPANGTFALTPGGNHIMLMELSGPIKAGDSVSVTLKLSDGSTVSFDALAKDFAGAQESYAPSAEASESTDSMGSMDSMSH
jgi:periplasmic copper chaperone A